MPVAYSANIKASEVLDEVLEAHPEGAVLVVEYRLDDIFHLLGPEGRGITPIPVPLELTPRVSDVNKLISKGFFDLDDTISMARNQTSLFIRATCLGPLILSRCASREQIPILIKL